MIVWCTLLNLCAEKSESKKKKGKYFQQDLVFSSFISVTHRKKNIYNPKHYIHRVVKTETFLLAYEYTHAQKKKKRERNTRI